MCETKTVVYQRTTYTGYVTMHIDHQGNSFPGNYKEHSITIMGKKSHTFDEGQKDFSSDKET